MLRSLHGSAKRLAAVALVDLAWREIAFAAANAVKASRRERLFTRDVQLGGLGQYLYEQEVIDKGQFKEFRDGDAIRNASLHAKTLDEIPERAALRRMLANAIKHQDV